MPVYRTNNLWSGVQQKTGLYEIRTLKGHTDINMKIFGKSFENQNQKQFLKKDSKILRIFASTQSITRIVKLTLDSNKIKKLITFS